MEFSHYINVLRKNLASIVLLTLLGGGMVYVFSRHQPRVYEATATLVINAAAPSSLIPYLSAVVGNNGAVSSVQALADSYAILLRSRSFDAEVIQKLHLAVTPDQLGSSISSGLIGDTNYWTISVAWNDPVQAAALANGIARIFIEANAAAQASAQSSVAASDIGQALTYFQRKIKVLRRRYDAILADPRATPAQVNTAENQLGALEDIYYKLLATAGTSALSTGTNTAVLGDPAVVPGAPISPKATRNLVLGLVSGLLIGLALAFLLDYLDYSLRTAEDLEQLMGQAPLCVIGRFAAGGRRKRGLFGLPFKRMAAGAMGAAARPANGNGRQPRG
jgi:capsular polysaccharide biosynthesis protein